MSEVEKIFVLDSENGVPPGVLISDKLKAEKTAKLSFGSVARKGLADISNLPQRPKPSIQDEKSQYVSVTAKEYIDQLQKENMALMKLIADRNKIIEFSAIELQKLRLNLQKVQQQNMQLAQSNSQMLAELNSGRDKLKALQHDLGCKNGLLKAKKKELEEKAKLRTCQKIVNEVGTIKCEEAGEVSREDRVVCKTGNANRRQQSKSFGPSTVKQIQAKDKGENKRLFARRQSARFKSEEPKPAEDLFEMDDAKFPVCPLRDDQMQGDASTSMCSLVHEDEKEGNSAPRYGVQEFGRSSIGRPLRQAAKKVQSYKEIPLNVKMRRTE